MFYSIQQLYWLLCLVVYFGTTALCSAQSDPVDSTSICDSIQQKIRACDFIHWNGLPTDCNWTSFVGEIPTDWTERAALPLSLIHISEPTRR